MTTPKMTFTVLPLSGTARSHFRWVYKSRLFPTLTLADIKLVRLAHLWQTAFLQRAFEFCGLHHQPASCTDKEAVVLEWEAIAPSDSEKHVLHIKNGTGGTGLCCFALCEKNTALQSHRAVTCSKYCDGKSLIGLLECDCSPNNLQALPPDYE